MKALIVIEIDENRLMAESNDLYDRLKGRKCELKPMPQKLKLRIQREWITDYDRYEIGYNACLDKITGETE